MWHRLKTVMGGRYPSTKTGWFLAGIGVCAWGLLAGFITHDLYADLARLGLALNMWLRARGFPLVGFYVDWFSYELPMIPLLFACGFLLPRWLGSYWFRLAAVAVLGYWTAESYMIKSLLEAIGRFEFRTAAYYLFVVGVSFASALGGAWLGARWLPPKHPPRPACSHCGYCLVGLTEARCPECGQAFDPAKGQCGQ